VLDHYLASESRSAPRAASGGGDQAETATSSAPGREDAFDDDIPF